MAKCGSKYLRAKSASGLATRTLILLRAIGKFTQKLVKQGNGLSLGMGNTSSLDELVD